MSDLIARLQSLTEPSREIDAEIALANGWTVWTKPSFKGGDETYWRNTKHAIQPGPPRYTESLDVALTLMPPQMTWSVGKWSSRSGDGPSVYWADLHQDDPEEHWAARHPLPAVALLIVIIKAQESAPPSEDKRRRPRPGG